MLAKLAQIALSSLGSMIMGAMTEDFFKWFFLWASEKAVKKTNFKWDDELHKKIKETVEKK